MNSVVIEIRPVRCDLRLPAYQTPLSSGMDIHAAIDEPLSLDPGQRMVIPTGFAIALPVGYEAQVRPRSGLAKNNGITVLNTPGTIDADYRCEVQVILINLGSESFQIEPGRRIAQLVITPVVQAAFRVVNRLSETSRDGGLGSTGK